MIAYLEGIVAASEIDSVVLDVHGVGYGVTTSLNDHNLLNSGAVIRLWYFLQVQYNPDHFLHLLFIGSTVSC